jgi:hypothetical protein
MKSILLISIVICLPVTSMSSGVKSVSFLGDEPYSVTEFNVRATGHVNVSTSGGHILLVGTDSRTAKVEMHVRKNGRNLTPDDTDLAAYTITIEQRGNTIMANAERTRSIGNLWKGHNNVSISFTVYVPQGFTSNLRTSGGRVGIRNMSADQDARTSGGSVSLDNIRGKVDARTSGGSITISNVFGDLHASTSGGSIMANGISGKVDLSTSGGSIIIDNALGRIHATTSGGSIVATVREVTESLRLSTSGGSVTVTLPAGQGFDIDARGTRVESDLSRFTGTNERGRMSGTVNGGGMPVHLRTSAGTVRISNE